MLCSVLHGLYGRDTRSAQILNLVTAMWWIVATGLTMADILTFDLPSALSVSLYMSLAINGLIVLFGGGALALDGRPKQVSKSFALITGALWHAILANMYVSQYPPLSMMMCVSVVLSLWFVGAVIFIAKCEGVKNGVVARH